MAARKETFSLVVPQFSPLVSSALVCSMSNCFLVRSACRWRPTGPSSAEGSDVRSDAHVDCVLSASYRPTSDLELERSQQPSLGRRQARPPGISSLSTRTGKTGFKAEFDFWVTRGRTCVAVTGLLSLLSDCRFECFKLTAHYSHSHHVW
jgi:hypothetical protein